MAFIAFGRGTTLLKGLVNHGYWPLTSPGMILQANVQAGKTELRRMPADKKAKLPQDFLVSWLGLGGGGNVSSRENTYLEVTFLVAKAVISLNLQWLEAT